MVEVAEGNEDADNIDGAEGAEASARERDSELLDAEVGPAEGEIPLALAPALVILHAPWARLRDGCDSNVQGMRGDTLEMLREEALERLLDEAWGRPHEVAQEKSHGASSKKAALAKRLEAWGTLHGRMAAKTKYCCGELPWLEISQARQTYEVIWKSHATRGERTPKTGEIMLLGS